MNLSVIVITLNEEENLGQCLRSLPFGAEIVVVDSGSTDKTKEIALSCGAAFYVRAFDDYSSQKNFALQLASRSWVLAIDADEELSSDCVVAVKEIIKSDDMSKAYRLNRHLIFMGKNMRFGKTRDFPLRIFPRGKGVFVGKIHESIVLTNDLTVQKLPSKARVWHNSYEDLEDYLEKFNRYTTRVAENHFRNGKNKPKKTSIALRPWVEFLSRYLLRGGFLDGYPGYVYALLSSYYAFTKYEKLRLLYESDNHARTKKQ